MGSGHHAISTFQAPDGALRLGGLGYCRAPGAFHLWLFGQAIWMAAVSWFLERVHNNECFVFLGKVLFLWRAHLDIGKSWSACRFGDTFGEWGLVLNERCS